MDNYGWYLYQLCKDDLQMERLLHLAGVGVSSMSSETWSEFQQQSCCLRARFSLAAFRCLLCFLRMKVFRERIT